MSSRGPLALTLAVLVCALPASGCLGDGGEDAGRAPVKGNRLVIYSSLPRTGPMAGAAEAVAAGQRQALADARRRAGRYRVRLVELPATTVETDPGDPWDPGKVSENAGRAAADPRTIAYLGELGLGASAVSLPITNEAGILQVSPGDGLTGLTRRLGRTTARPERYYPSGRRTFVRLVPDDLAQAQRVVRRMVALGGDRAALVAGPGVYAREFADDLTAEARRAGLEPVEAIDLREGPGPVAEATRELVELAPDSVLVAAARSRSLAALLAGLQRRMPQARLFGGGGVLVGDPISSGGDPLPPLEAVAARAPTSRSRTAGRWPGSGPGRGCGPSAPRRSGATNPSAWCSTRFAGPSAAAVRLAGGTWCGKRSPGARAARPWAPTRCGPPERSRGSAWPSTGSRASASHPCAACPEIRSQARFSPR